MLPVAILPAAGILLAFGNAMHNEQLVALAPWLKMDVFVMISSVMEAAGQIVFDNLPLLFAVGTALGLAGGDGVAALAALVGYLIMNATMGQVMHITIDDIYGYANGAKELSQANKLPANALILGIPTLQTGVFGGLSWGRLQLGVIINTTILRYHRFRILCRKRFVPIVTSVVAIITGILLSFVWPPIQGGLNGLSNFLLDKNLTLTTFILVLLNVLLFHLDYTIFSMHHFGLNLDNIKIMSVI